VKSYNHIMKSHLACLLASFLVLAAPCVRAIPDGEHLGTLDFPVSCLPPTQAQFNRGVALEHDFWYSEAKPQFERILKADPACAMAHWGVAMSVFHEIWNRPDDATMALGWRELQAAKKHPAKSAREREYIAALAIFYRPDDRDYLKRAAEYAAAMGALYQHYPNDVDAGSFYALALLAAQSPSDTSLNANRNAMAVLSPLFQKFPDHPGVVHYIIHACDTPVLASDGLAAARHYGEIAPSGPHAVHMPGHIFCAPGYVARRHRRQRCLGRGLARCRGNIMKAVRWISSTRMTSCCMPTCRPDRMPHAKEILNESAAMIDHFEHMPNMAEHYMSGMFPFYRTEFPTIFDLEDPRLGGCRRARASRRRIARNSNADFLDEDHRAWASAPSSRSTRRSRRPR